MNRHERRKAGRVKTTTVDIRSLDSMCDVQVEGKAGRVVMIVANAGGRKAAEELWPDVQWTRDELLASVRSPDWMFTHIRVTKLPPDFEQRTPLVFASPDALAFVVAAELHHHIRTPERVMFFSGQDDDLKVNILGAPFKFASGGTMFAEYMPPGSPLVSGNESVH
jgi:DNA-binding transcriptional regulator YdaS (Cro superfamily)